MLGLLQAFIGILFGYPTAGQAEQVRNTQEYYQTWIVSNTNTYNETLQEQLQNISLTEVKTLLETLGVDLKFGPSAHLPTTTEEPPVTLLEEDYLIYSDDLISLCMPQRPRVPHHLRIVLNRTKATLSEMTADEAVAMHTMLQQVAMVLRDRFDTPDFVVARSNEIQQGQWGVSMEILPPRPDSKDVLNIADKLDSNRYVHYRHLPLPQYRWEMTADEIDHLAAEWQAAMRDAWWYTPPEIESKSRDAQWIQIRTDIDTATDYLLNLFAEALRIEGFTVQQEIHRERPEGDRMRIYEMRGCAFCRSDVLDYQRVYEEEGICILYNYVSPFEAAHFLVIPTRHCERFEELTEQEVRTLHELEVALIAALEEEHGHSNVLLLCQNAPCVGQTVPHMHDKVQVVELLPYLVNALRSAVGGFEIVSGDEMRAVTERIGMRVRQHRKEVKKDAA